MRKKIFTLLLVLMVGFTLISCDEVDDIIIDDVPKLNIVDAGLNDDNELIFELSDGTLINVGDITGQTGEQGIPGVEGIGIKLIFINDEKKLIVTLTDDTTFDLGVVVGNDGQDGVDGREVEFNVSDTHIEWRYVGEETWKELINLDLLKGAAGEAGSNGTDGREVVIEIVDNEIVWKYEGEEDYHSLIDLEDLKGKDGTDGSDGKDGLDGQDGTDGLSAYQIYLKYNVNYNKTEAEWLTDLVRGKLSDSDTLDVLTYEQLLLAISSGETKIQLQNNISALETVKVTSLVNINFNGYTLNGNLDVVTEEFGIMNITGKGTLTGNFRIDAINATLNSDLNVDGETIIDNIAPLTFNTTGIHKLGIEVKSSGRINIQGLASETTVTINTLVGKNVTVEGSVKKIIVTGQGDVTLISAIVKFIKVETKTNFNISQGSIIEKIEGLEAGIDSLIVISEDSVIPSLGESNNIGNIVLDSHTKTVTDKTQLESALANSNITHIYINGTIGSEESYTIYTLDRDNVTIKGLNEAKVYGTFIIKANSVTVEDLSIQNQGNLTVNGSTPSNQHRSGIYVWSNSITLRNNIFTNGLGGQQGLSNAVQVMASENVDLDVFVIEGNQFIGHDNEVPNWSSSGLVFVQGYESGALGGAYGHSIEGNKSYYDHILSSNTFTNNAHDLTHQDWLTGLKVLYPFVAVNENKNEGYHSIQEALNDAATGDTIKLNSDVELKTKGLIIGTDKEITLDLAGYVISGVLENVGASALIANNGYLTIEDSSTDKTGKITNQAKNPDNEWEAGFPAYANNTITNSGNLIINGGRIENTTDGRGASYVIDNNSGNRDAVVIVNKGHIINPNGNFAIRQFANSTVNKNSVTINGGIVEGTRAVWIQLPGSSGQEKLAELTVNGGTLKSTDKGEGGYNLAVYSYTFGDSFAKTKITITGGTFDGDVALTGGSPKAPMETVEVSNEAIFLGQRGVFSYANVVNETQNNGYTTIQAAIDAAADGDTIQIAAGTYDESVVVPEEKVRSITILGANSDTIPTSSEVDGTIITGGMTFGRDISTNPTIEKSITVKGITFSGGSGLIFKDIRNVTVENNKFIGINAGDAAVTVLDPSPNDRAGVTTISNNYIDGVSGLGIYVRRPAPTTVIEGNHVENTDHNSIQVVGVSAGPDVTITGNTLINWDQNRDADGGRAIRINFDPVDDSTALTVTGNTFLPNDDAEPTDPDYVKITGVSTADNNVNNLISSLIDQNTWPSETEYGTVILVNETTGPVAS